MRDEEVVVRADGLSKRFRLYRSPRALLAEWLRLPGGPRFEEFWALQDISFELRRGECLGVIGVNGAGKSTLLKLLSGVLYPSAGRFEIHGTVLSLLELGSGFAPELTGRQNVAQSARWLSMPRSFLADREAEIEAFADIGEYYDRPVREYSSGMFVRLAFSLFSAMQPDIFVVDEVLAVGDLRFSAKAIGRIMQMLEHGTTLLFVSHDLQLVNRLCTRALWLHAGRVHMDGPPSEVTRAYQQFVIHGTTSERGSTSKRGTTSERGSTSERHLVEPAASARGELAQRRSLQAEVDHMCLAIARTTPVADAPARISRVTTLDASGTVAVQFETHAALTAEITLEALADIDRLVVGIQVRDAEDRMLWTTRLDWQKAPLPSLKKGEQLNVVFSTNDLLLGPGEYQLTVACHQFPRDDRVFHWIDGVWRFQVLGTGSPAFEGPVDLDLRLTFLPNQAEQEA